MVGILHAGKSRVLCGRMAPGIMRPASARVIVTSPACEDDDVVPPPPCGRVRDRDGAAVAAGRARVVEQVRDGPGQGGVDAHVLVQAEDVGA